MREISDLIDKFIHTFDQDELLQLWNILKHGAHTSELYQLCLPETKSHIVQENNFIIYTCIYKGLAGLFKKGSDFKLTTTFGGFVCDFMKQITGNMGFISTDELPAYGISSHEKRLIMQITDCLEGDVGILFAYNKIQATNAQYLLFSVIDGLFKHLLMSIKD
jgi:Glu-tRNA(Gln) amidotransferase subunit E-like FAD-binding protein